PGWSFRRIIPTRSPPRARSAVPGQHPPLLLAPPVPARLESAAARTGAHRATGCWRWRPDGRCLAIGNTAGEVYQVIRDEGTVVTKNCPARPGQVSSPGR